MFNRKFINKLVADLVTFLHFFWTGLLIVGTFYIFFHPEYALYQVILLTITILLNLPFNDSCPLTVIEEKLRKKVDPDYKNHNSFLTTYVNKTFKTNFKAYQINNAIILFYLFSYSVAAWYLKFGY